jgi:hypothetical protein
MTYFMTHVRRCFIDKRSIACTIKRTPPRLEPHKSSHKWCITTNITLGAYMLIYKYMKIIEFLKVG